MITEDTSSIVNM